MLVTAAGCSDDARTDRAAEDDFTPPFCEADELLISSLLDRMSLEQKAAQTLVLGEQAYPTYLPETTRRHIAELGIGGVFLQPFNALFPDADKMSRLLNELNTLALERDPAIPLLFSLDQEGGTTQAWQQITGGTDGPGNMALGALDDPAATREMYAMMGREVRSFGANVAYAPEFDLVASHEAAWVFTKGFGETAELTTRHARPAVHGFQSELILGAMKHFPGGGCVFDDTHAESPTCDLDRETLLATHVPPFASAIASGADLVMVSPVIYTALDAELPAGLSRKVKLDFLRGELGFEGLISTGALDMPPYQHDRGRPKEVLAIASGADLLLYVAEVQTFEEAEQIIANLVAAVRDGTLPAAQLDESVARILRHKQRYCLFAEPFTDPAHAAATSGSEQHRQLAAPIIAGAITLVRNDAGLWPLAETTGEGLLVVSPEEVIIEDPATGFGMYSGTTLAEQINQLAPLAERVLFQPGGGEETTTAAVEHAAAAGVEAVIIGSYNAHYDERQAAMVRQIGALGKPTIVLALGTPFDLLSFPDVTTFLAVYSLRDLALQMAAETLFGRHEPLGRLPVTLPGLHERGHSAYRSVAP